MTGNVAVSQTDPSTQIDVASAASAPALDPSRIRDRIDALIENQVAAGQITGDQAGVIRQVLSAPELEAADVIENTGTSASAGTDDGANASAAVPDARPNPSDTLASFIQQVQRSQSRTIGYGSDGARSSDLTSSRLLDFNT
ncbi:hypothetical protein MKK88_02235 [Methylobacterium sp. E-005]|uniref:hypothetical protein n=1 Tax=Methylobacterium sp. E-005 TaxID=2836549 RepID=UPI001FBB3927|nr:hypothetical protein [Methylobacterium sp. E-005]MCJ2084814.1 hypothetical protein [Methylobacterium sp. E-005]